MRSVFKFAPWIRYIHIVVHDGQIPHWLDVNHPKIRIVPHSSIFKKPKDELPTFNSLVIESYIHRIPNLSETYLYMNNDLMFGRSVGLEAFIDNDQYIRYVDYEIFFAKNFCAQLLYDRNWDLFKKIGSDCFCFGDAMFINSLASLSFYNFRPRFWYMHIPHLFYKPIVENMNKELDSILTVTRSHRFRQNTDINIFMQFESYLSTMKNPWKKIKNVNYGMLKQVYESWSHELYLYKVFQNHDATEDYYSELKKDLETHRPLFFGIDDDLDNPTNSTINFHRTHLIDIFESYFPELAPWEFK